MNLPQHPLLHLLMEKSRIKECKCDDPYGNCIEAGKISWDNCPDACFLHVRFDGCLCRDSSSRRCDCIIFRFGLDNDQTVMFAVEVKESNPNLGEVRDKLQTCVNIMMGFLPDPKDQFRIIPVLCAQAFRGFSYRAVHGYRITVFGEKILIRKRFHGQDINIL